MPPTPHELAAHLDRLRRFFTTLHDPSPMRDIGSGFIRLSLGSPAAEFASTSKDNARWYTGETPIRAEHLEVMIAFAREHGRQRFFLWAAPWLIDADSERDLAAAGATPLPHVRYVALSRAAAEAPTFAPPGVEVRRIPPAEARELFSDVDHWYGQYGVASTLRGVLQGSILFFTAFIEGLPAAVAHLTPEGEWAFVGGAVTDPAFRGRGAQKALIAARLHCAAELGVRWCSCETNDGSTISLDNLKRCGFEETLDWRVFQWDERAG